MFNKSRIDIYDYLYNLFYDVVTKNVYSMNEPQELTKSDTENGFIVLHVGNLVDESEFDYEAFGRVRCYVEAFVPPITRGIIAAEKKGCIVLDYNKYKAFEASIDNVITTESSTTTGEYSIESDSVISMDAEVLTNANNIYFTFIKSFIVNINEQE